jgi:hypothetical protein
LAALVRSAVSGKAHGANADGGRGIPYSVDFNMMLDEKDIAETKAHAGSRDLSRHPLITLIIGFFLTGILGTFLSDYYSTKRAQAERTIAEQKGYVEASTIAIQEFSNLVYERHTWSMMLASSIARRAPIDEVRARKNEYDRVFVKWNTAYQSNLLTIRKVMKAPRFSTFEAYVDGGLSTMLQQIDACLTSAYDVRISYDSSDLSVQRLRACRATKRLEQARDCSEEITSGLFELVNSSQRDEELITDINQRINSRCKQDP